MIEVQNESLVSGSPQSALLGDSRFRRLQGFEELSMRSFRLMEVYKTLCRERIVSGQTIRSLVGEVPLSGLLKLVSLLYPRSQSCRLQPVYFLPVSSTVERCSRVEFACAEIESLLARFDSDVSSQHPIALAFDSWKGNYREGKLFEVLASVRELMPRLSNSYFFFGPSMRDILSLTEGSSGLDLPTLSAKLRELEIHRVEGAADPKLRAHLVELGFRFSVGQEISLERGSSSSTPHGDDLVSKLYELQKLDGAGAGVDVWFPWIRTSADANSLRVALLQERLLRSIAIARLVLPNISFIRAPLSVFGLRTAQLAVSFGANDLGFVALDRVSSRELGLVLHSEAAEVVRFDTVRINVASSGGQNG